MKFLVFACLIAVSLAVPVARPDDDDDNEAVESFQSVTSIVGEPTVIGTQILSGTPITNQKAVQFSVPISINQGAQIYTGAVPYSVGASAIYKADEIDNDDDDVKFVKSGYYASSFAPAGVSVAAGPAITTYSAGQAVASPAIATYNYGQAVASPAVTTYNVENIVAPAQYKAAVAAPVQYTAAVAAPVQYKAAVAAPVQYTGAVATPVQYTAAVAAPVQYKAAVAAPVQYTATAVAPSVATVQHEALVHEVKPVSVAVPSAITYEAAHTVELPPKEINVPVQRQTVHVPVEQRIHYGTENFVAGSTTKVYKPQITAPAITAPRVFVAKTRQAAPEVTVHQSEVTVEQKSPNYVAAPFDAGIIVEKAAPHINQIDVPTPVEVPHPVNVPTPYAVPVAHPVKVKSSVNPVVNVDVHTVQTENVVTPIEYTAHHHVATAPAVAVQAVQAAPAVGIAANVVPTAVTYGAASVAPGAVAVQGVATDGLAIGGVSNYGVVTQGVAPYGVSTQGVVTGGQAVRYAAAPGQNIIYGSSPALISGGFSSVPSSSFITGQNIQQGEVKFISGGESSGETAAQVTAYSGGIQGVVGQQVISGAANIGGVAPVAKVYFDSSVNLTE